MKSFVTVEQAVCPVCGVAHDTGNLLINKRMTPIFAHTTTTHYELCPEHKRLADEDYIAFVECSNEPEGLSDAVRTGQIMHLRRSVYGQIFNTPAPEGPMAFVEIGVIAKVQEMVK